MDVSKIKISIIIPVFNISEELPNCLDSVLAQTHRNIEVITVEDGSTDGSGDILDKYAKKDGRIKVIHKQNGGVSAARNDALDAATGDWIGFVDGDDLIDPDMYELLLSNALKYEADISHCGIQTLDSKGEIRKFYGTGKIKIQDNCEGLYDLISGREIEPSTGNKLYSKSLFDNVRYDGEIRYNEDLLINVRLFLKSKKSVFDDICKYTYIRRADSASKGKITEKKLFDPINARRIIMSLLNDYPQRLKNAALESYLHANISGYSSVAEQNRDNLKNAKKQIVGNMKNERKNFFVLPKKSRVHAYLIVCFPVLYKPITGLYNKLFSNSVYG